MILDRYVFRLWVLPFLGGLALVMGVFLLSRALRLMDLATDFAAAWGMLSHLLFLTIPYFLLLACPIAFFLSLQHVISHLQGTSELDALRAAGVSYLRLLRAPLFSAFVLFLVLLAVAMWWMPSALADFNNLMRQVYASSGGISAVPQRFIEVSDDLVIYAGGDRQKGELSQVLIEDRRSSTDVLYVAQSARIRSAAGQVHISLHEGARFEGRGSNLRFLKFDDYKVSLSVENGRWQPVKKERDPMLMPPEMLLSAVLSENAHAKVELARRILLPSMVLVLFFFALPISLKPKRTGKSGVFILGIVVLLTTYNLHLFIYRSAAEGQVNYLFLWLEQLLLLGLGVGLFWWIEKKDHPVFITAAVEIIIDRIVQPILRFITLRRSEHPPGRM